MVKIALASLMMAAALALPGRVVAMGTEPAGTQAARDADAPEGQVADLRGYISIDDYPREAIRNREQGLVVFRLWIDRRGRVHDCTILQSSGSATLDGTTCRLMRERARFVPARDAEGNAAPDTWDGRIRWTLP